jgi:type IV secretion system protein VirB2
MRNIFKQVTGLAPQNLIGNSARMQEQNKRIVKFMVLSASAALLVIEPSIATATVPTLDTSGVATGGANGISRAVNAIVQTLTGTLGQSIAVLAVVIMGIMAMFGRLAWDHAMKVILGIAIVFGAATIITWITTGTAET